jgi:glycosyltransferase involved in cell wall biosynthesis
VIIPVHGRARYLGAALDSVTAQTYEHHEVVIVLDGECAELPELDRPGVRVLRLPHAGVASARNAGLDVARGELIALLDHDDEWREDKLERQVALLDARPELGFALSQVDVLLEPETQPPPSVPRAWLEGPAPGFIPSTWLVRREAFRDVGKFDQGYEMGCDTDWLLRAKLGVCPCEMIEEPLVRWRLHGSNATYDDATVRREHILAMRRSAARQHNARALRVGAVIAARNYECYVGEAIESLLEQTLSPTEIVVVDDGSDDSTATVAARYGPRVRVVSIETSGIGAARNRGIAEVADVDAVVLLDADDLMTPQSIERRAQVLAVRKDVDIVFGHSQRFEEVNDGEPVATGPRRPAHLPAEMLVRRSAIERVGPFATGMRVAEGLDWLLRARELGLRDVTVPEVVC